MRMQMLVMKNNTKQKLYVIPFDYQRLKPLSFLLIHLLLLDGHATAETNSILFTLAVIIFESSSRQQNSKTACFSKKEKRRETKFLSFSLSHEQDSKAWVGHTLRCMIFVPDAFPGKEKKRNETTGKKPAAMKTTKKTTANDAGRELEEMKERKSLWSDHEDDDRYDDSQDSLSLIFLLFSCSFSLRCSFCGEDGNKRIYPETEREISWIRFDSLSPLSSKTMLRETNETESKKYLKETEWSIFWWQSSFIKDLFCEVSLSVSSKTPFTLFSSPSSYTWFFFLNHHVCHNDSKL